MSNQNLSNTPTLYTHMQADTLKCTCYMSLDGKCSIQYILFETLSSVSEYKRPSAGAGGKSVNTKDHHLGGRGFGEKE